VGKVTEFPQGAAADVVIVKVVVVDVEAGRGEAPNNKGEGICADIHPEHQGKKTAVDDFCPLYFIGRLELF
jgi:hypothetical protein